MDKSRRLEDSILRYIRSVNRCKKYSYLHAKVSTMLRMPVLVLLLVPTALCAQSPINLYKINPSEPGRPILTLPTQVLVPGKLNIVTFSMYFTACPPCVNEINAVNQRLKLLQLDTSVVYSVITSVKKEVPGIVSLSASSSLKDNQWTFPVYIDTNFAFSTASGFTSFPMTLLIDGDGKGLYGSDLAKDTVIGLRTKKLFDKISEKLHLSPMISIGDGPMAVQDIERLAYSSSDFFEKTMQWNGLTKVSQFYKKQTTIGQVALFEDMHYGQYYNWRHIYLTDPTMMRQYIRAFEAAGYKGEMGFSMYDSVTNYNAYRRKLFKLETYVSKSGGQTFYNLRIKSLNLGNIKDFDENARVKRLSRLSVTELEMLTGYDPDRAGIYLIGKGFIPHEYRKDRYNLTTNGVDGYEIAFDGGLWYSSKDRAFSNQLRAELLEVGYQLQTNKIIYKNDTDHFEYAKGKLQVEIFKTGSSEEYIMLMKKIK